MQITFDQVMNGKLDDFDWSVFENVSLECWLKETTFQFNNMHKCDIIIAGCEFDVGITLVAKENPEYVIGCLSPGNDYAKENNDYVQRFIEFINIISSGRFDMDYNDSGLDISQADLVGRCPFGQ